MTKLGKKGKGATTKSEKPKVPQTTLGIKINGTLQVLDGVAKGEAVSEAIRAVRDKISSLAKLPSRVCKEICDDLNKVAKVSDIANGEIKKASQDSAPIGSLAVVHKRLQTDAKRKQKRLEFLNPSQSTMATK
jgi:hypothetical protein